MVRGLLWQDGWNGAKQSVACPMMVTSTGIGIGASGWLRVDFYLLKELVMFCSVHCFTTLLPFSRWQ